MRILLSVIVLSVFAEESGTILLELEENLLSKALLDTVYLQLELGISGSDLVSNLEDVVSEIKSQEQVAAVVLANQQAICNVIPEFVQKVSEIQKSVNAVQENLNIARPELELLNNEIAAKEDEIERYKQEIASATERRNSDKAKWLENDQENVKNIEASIGAIKLTSQLKYDDSSVVLIQKKLNDLAGTLSNAAKSTQNDLYSPAITALTELSKANPQTLSQVLSLLESLKNDLVQAKGQSSRLEEESQRAFEDYIESIEDSIESNTQDMSLLNRKKHRLEAFVNTSNTEISEDKSRIQTFEEILEEQQTLCNEWTRLNKLESKEREVFVQDIYKVIELVNTNIAGVKEYFDNR